MSASADKPRFREQLAQFAAGWRRMAARPPLQGLVFLLAVILFIWPYITAEPWSQLGLYVYILLAWAAVVVLLILIGMSLGRRDGKGGGGPNGGR